MNVTNFQHAGFALLIQFGAWVVTGDWWIGAAAGSFFFLGREHAQAERRIAGTRPVSELKPWQGFLGWNTDSILDAVFPIVACTAVAMLMR